jgi:hypothetical protein
MQTAVIYYLLMSNYSMLNEKAFQSDLMKFCVWFNYTATENVQLILRLPDNAQENIFLWKLQTVDRVKLYTFDEWFYVKLSLYLIKHNATKTYRPKGIQLHVFLISEVNCELHALADLPQGKESPVRTVQQAEWAPGPICGSGT